MSLFTTSFPLQVLTTIQTPTAPPKILRKPNNLRKHVMNECANRLRKFRAWSRDWGEGQPFFGIGDEYAYIDREVLFFTFLSSFCFTYFKPLLYDWIRCRVCSCLEEMEHGNLVLWKNLWKYRENRG